MTFDADAKTTEAAEPSVLAFEHPTILAEPAAVFAPALCDHGPDAAITQRTPMSCGIVAAISVDDAGLLKRSATDTAIRGFGPAFRPPQQRAPTTNQPKRMTDRSGQPRATCRAATCASASMRQPFASRSIAASKLRPSRRPAESASVSSRFPV
jgi:hypothetical protein